MMMLMVLSLKINKDVAYYSNTQKKHYQDQNSALFTCGRSSASNNKKVYQLIE